MTIRLDSSHHLAENRQARYALIPPEKPSPLENEAVADLKRFLNEITGADFKIDPAARKNRLLVGHAAPGDTRELASRERRIRSQGNDIHIYGEGVHGNAFAVYDFLEEFLGCRWYSVWGDMTIPRQESLRLPAIAFARIPSFLCLEAGYPSGLVRHHPAVKDFFRRRRMHVWDDGCAWIGPSYHTLPCYIPSGTVPCGKRFDNTFGPYPYFKHQRYFETHPEFFTMNPEGKRVPRAQLCFANPALRQTLTANLEYTIAREYAGRGHAVMAIDANDRGGGFCHCPACRRLVRKYRSPGGPFYDYLIPLARTFLQKYPEIVIRFLAYHRDMTERPPPGIERFPENLVPFFAPLNGADFIKPLKHPLNRVALQNLQAWSEKAETLWMWCYPSTYARPTINYPLTANIQRIVDDLRTAHEYRVRMISAEFGYGPVGNMGFNELRLYLMSHLAQRIDLDEQQLIADFMQGYYGRAAPLMLDYLRELEEESAREKRVLRWNPDPRVLSYLTPSRLLRWSERFDEMERQVREEPRKRLNVCRARTNLDEAMAGAWPSITAETGRDIRDLSRLRRRHRAAVEADVNDTFAGSGRPDTERKLMLRRRLSGFRQHFAVAKGGRPLPKALAAVPPERVFRALPSVNKSWVPREPGAPFGLAAKGVLPETDWALNLVYADGYRNDRLPFAAHPLSRKRVRSATKSYRYHYLGHATLSPDCHIDLGPMLPGSIIFVGHFFRSREPRAAYDVHIALKYETPGILWVGESVLVKRA